MSYDSKIAAVREVVEQHNSNVTDDSNKVDFDQFLEKLRNMGGSSDEALKAVSWEDLQECGLPKIMARRLSYVFRKDSDDNSGASSAYVSTKKASTLTPKELIERYNPKDVKNSVGKRLRDLSDGKAFIVFDDSSNVLVDASTDLLKDIMSGLPSVETTFVEGRPLSVYKVGDRPDSYAQENPLYHGKALRSEERCCQTGRSWAGIPVITRQLLYIAISQTHELVVRTVADAGDVMDRVMSQDCTLATLRSRYPKASKSHDELLNIGRLPLLKIKLGGSSNSKSNNPFGASKSKVW
jgi:hypothetical protein